MDDLYREFILDNYRNPKNFGKISDPDYSSKLENSLCGDSIGIEIKLSDKKNSRIIKDIGFSGHGCAICIASASILTESVKGKAVSAAVKLSGKEFLKMIGVNLTPVRIKCALLPLEVLMHTLALVK